MKEAPTTAATATAGRMRAASCPLVTAGRPHGCGLGCHGRSLQQEQKQKGHDVWRKPVHMYHLLNQLSRMRCKGWSRDLAVPVNNDRGEVSELHQPRLIIKVLV